MKYYKWIIVGLFLSCSIAVECSGKRLRDTRTRTFGGWSIAQELFEYILMILPEGSTLLELGSGWASGELSKYYTVFSVEHDKRFLNKFTTNYIYAPIVKNWYDVRVLAQKLPKKYDLILIDGPLAQVGRYGFYTHLKFFKADVPIIINNVERSEEYRLLMDLVTKLNRMYEIFVTDESRYAIIYPKTLLM